MLLMVWVAPRSLGASFLLGGAAVEALGWAALPGALSADPVYTCTRAPGTSVGAWLRPCDSPHSCMLRACSQASGTWHQPHP